MFSLFLRYSNNWASLIQVQTVQSSCKELVLNDFQEVLKPIGKLEAC